MLLACIAHVGLPAQLAAAVRAEVEVSEARAGFINFPRQRALGRCLGGPGACGQHLHHHQSGVTGCAWPQCSNKIQQSKQTSGVL